MGKKLPKEVQLNTLNPFKKKEEEPKTALTSIKVSVGNAAGKAKGAVSGVKDSAAVSAMQQAVGMKQEDNLCPSLTWRQRVYGCCGCFATGCVLSFIGWILWQRAPPTRAASPPPARTTGGMIASFAIVYTLGNITSLCSSCFLFGPRRQLRVMRKAKRRIAVGVYLGLMVLTLTVAGICIGVQNSGGFIPAWIRPIFLVLIFAQWCALIWYIASFIPYGQTMIKKFFKSVGNFE